jgi:hypothetical protein
MSSPIDLLNAFEQKNFGKFQECLEVYLANPNEFDEITNNRTVFETILSTPKSAEYIKLCLKNDADFYMVRTTAILFTTQMMISVYSVCIYEIIHKPHIYKFFIIFFYFLIRKTTTGNIQYIV